MLSGAKGNHFYASLTETERCATVPTMDEFENILFLFFFARFQSQFCFILSFVCLCV